LPTISTVDNIAFSDTVFHLRKLEEIMRKTGPIESNPNTGGDFASIFRIDKDKHSHREKENKNEPNY
jgi:hypothetical protein